MVALMSCEPVQAQACTASTQAGSHLRAQSSFTSFTFYATIDADSIRSYMPAGVAYMLPANSWARKRLAAPKLPAHVTETAADCGGFVATFRWGDYRYTPAEYVRWLASWQPTWAATMDYCCEDEITSGNAGIVAQRQWRTTEMAHLFWREYGRGRVPWVWVPTVQGWTVDDYRRHAREIRPLVARMADYYGSGAGFRVGIGTLCRRANVAMIRSVVNAVAAELPGIGLHLWGVKLAILKSPLAVPMQVVSVDSAAWSGLFGTGREEWKRSGLSQRAWAYTVALPHYTASLDVEIAPGAGGESGLTLGDTVPAQGEEDAADAAEEEARRVRVRDAMAHLTPRERMVVAFHYGIEPNPAAVSRPATLHEIGEMLGMSRERVRQIEAAALAKLRGHLSRDGAGGLTVSVVKAQRTVTAAA